MRVDYRKHPFAPGLPPGWIPANCVRASTSEPCRPPSSQLILSRCTYEASVSPLWTPHNLASVCALTAQIPTAGEGAVLLSAAPVTESQPVTQSQPWSEMALPSAVEKGTEKARTAGGDPGGEKASLSEKASGQTGGAGNGAAGGGVLEGKL